MCQITKIKDVHDGPMKQMLVREVPVVDLLVPEKLGKLLSLFQAKKLPDMTKFRRILSKR